MSLEETLSYNPELAGELESRMQKVSLVVSVVGLGLMILGFIAQVITGSALSIPGSSVLSFIMLAHLAEAPLSLAAMSIGIILLALLPMVRVVLALWLYLHGHNLVNMAAALVVMLELLMSLFSG